ncbi:MAG TPA: hypothetical protein VFI08_03175, partial [Spirochaetia bacterium]|nr:hypothetical protein [Spirochaetia bacterium]
MKVRALFLVIAVAALVACGVGTYHARAGEEIYGTWASEHAAQQRMVIAAGELKTFALADDTQPFNACTQVITARWTDP